MKKYILFLTIAFTLTSCFKKDHKIESIEIVGNKDENNRYINLCLEEEIGYASYYLYFEITFKNGTKLNEEDILSSGVKPEEKCFKIYTYTSFVRRHDSKEKEVLVNQIYKGNIKEMKISIRYEDYKGELIRTQIFRNL